MPKKDDIQIERPETFLGRERAVQRAGTVLLTLFVLAGAAGAFGNGPLARATTTAGGLELRYERFCRTTARTTIAITLRTGVADGQPVRVRLERDFVGHLHQLELRPADVLIGFDETHAIFEVPATGGRGHLELHFNPESAGFRQTAVVADGVETAHVRQLIYF